VNGADGSAAVAGADLPCVGHPDDHRVALRVRREHVPEHLRADVRPRHQGGAARRHRGRWVARVGRHLDAAGAAARRCGYGRPCLVAVGWACQMTRQAGLEAVGSAGPTRMWVAWGQLRPRAALLADRTVPLVAAVDAAFGTGPQDETAPAG
jgi:hypothetical protein